MKEIGERLKEVRNSLGITQEGVCDFVGLKQSQLSDFENGKKQISIAMLSKLANLYGVGIEFFVTGKGFNPHNQISLAFRTKKVSAEDTRVVLWAKQMLETYISVISIDKKEEVNG